MTYCAQTIRAGSSELGVTHSERSLTRGRSTRRERRNKMEQHRALAVRVGAAAVLLVALLAGSSSALAGSETPRGGDLVVSKECSGFVNDPPFCAITSSSLDAIPIGSKIIYLDPAGLGTAAGGAVVLDPPGPGNNKAFGTCFLGGNPMHCEFSGGTGKFTWFHASVVVTVTDLGQPTELWHWLGTYSFSPH